MKYREERLDANSYKQEYLDGIYRLIDRRQREAEKERASYINGIFDSPEKYRSDFKEMLGWPLVGYEKSGIPTVEMHELSREDGYRIYRMQFEVLDGLKMSGLLFLADGDSKKPLVIVQHGGLGTPECISNVYGDTANYNDMLHRVRIHGVHVFAPQLLIWRKEYNVEFNRQKIDACLKRVGSSITALEVYGIMRIIDYFETCDYVSSFGMVGLSYGGFYTQYTAAVDTRIKSAIACSFFGTRDKEFESDFTWHKSAERFDDAEIACLVYPRRLCIEIGKRDELFDYKDGERSFKKIEKLCGSVGTDWIELIVFDGTHEFYTNDSPIERMVKDLFEN